MMNMTTLLRYIESKLGFRFRDLEIDDNEIMDSIKNTTLPTFSSYFPCMYRKILDPAKDKVPGFTNRWYIDSNDPYDQYQVIGCAEVYIGDINNLGFTQDEILGSGYGTGWGEILRNARRSPVNPVVFDYWPPNQIEIRPSYHNHAFLATIKIVHPEHLQTIHPGMENDFKNLALYDIMTYLYSIRSRFTELNTPVGQINLNIDFLAQGEDKRDQLLERFRANFFKAANRKKIWIK